MDKETWNQIGKTKNDIIQQLQKTACIFAKNQNIQKLQIVMDTKTERLKFISAKPEKLN